MGWIRVVVLFGMLFGFGIQTGFAQWYEHYERAEKALNTKKWTVAINEINEALRRKGDSGDRVRTYGMHVCSYFPYFKLGIAYYHLDRLDSALQAFETELAAGQIVKSPRDLKELKGYLRLVLDAREAAAQAERERTDRIVEERVARSTVLASQGHLEDAMNALRTVDPEHPLVKAKMLALRKATARRDRENRENARARSLINQGKTLLADERYDKAASVLRQALEIRPNTEARRLLREAQGAMLTMIQAERDAEERRTHIANTLATARDQEAAGELEEALITLEQVLAIASDNSEAMMLLRRLQLAIDEAAMAEQEAARRREVKSLLAETAAEFTAGRFENALSAAHRALTIDPGNQAAMEYSASVFQEINKPLLVTKTTENMPPSICFADLRQEQNDGSRVQMMARPDFRLNGMAIDSSPVDVAFFDQANNPIEATSSAQPEGEYYATNFALSFVLEPGTTTFRVKATDSGGLSSSSSYTVSYLPPLYRKPWFWLILALVPLASTGVYSARRLRQRRQLLRRRFNPYIAGPPVLDEDMFFGRGPLVDRILQTIHNNSLLLYGERRIGKTSLQHHLKRRLLELQDPAYDFFPVFVDLQGTREERFFATLAEDIFQELAPLLDGLEPSGALLAGGEYGHRHLARDLRRVLKVLRTKSHKTVKLVLLIDEVDELNEYDPRVNQKLRSLFMKSFAENLVSVVSGVEISKQWEKEGSPWYNFFEEIEVKAINKDAARDLVARPMRNLFKVSDDLIDRILTITDCRPYLIQKICIALVNRLHEQKRRTITAADIEAVGALEEP